MKINEKPFLNRLDESKADTTYILNLLIEIGHLSGAKVSSKEEDLAGVDAWLQYQNSTENIAGQIKVRTDGRYDYIICIDQPFHGRGNSRSKVGRDMRGLKDNVSEWYYMAVRKSNEWQEIVRCKSEELLPIVEKVELEWKNTITEGYRDNFSSDLFSSEITAKWSLLFNTRHVFTFDNCEVWWKKNPNEAPKFLMFVPQNKLKSNELLWKNSLL